MATSNPIYFIVLMLLVALLPLAIGVFTSYVKLSVVLGSIKTGLGTQQVPGTVITMSLALGLTCFIMGPVFERSSEVIKAQDLQRLFEKPSVEGLRALTPALKPWEEFLRQHSGQREVAALARLSEKKVGKELEDGSGWEPPRAADAPLKIILPAFVLTELKQAFAMAFVLLLPFLVIDLVVANILAGLGMFMLSPNLISLPLKIVIFVVSDGWLLLAQGLIRSYLG